MRIGELGASIELKIRQHWSPCLTAAVASVGLLIALSAGVRIAVNHHRRATAREELSQLARGLNGYYRDNGYYPTTDEGLGALMPSLLIPLDDLDPGILIPPPLRSRPLLDPWGHPFVYESDGNSYLLKSLGPGGRGTDPTLTVTAGR